MAWVVDVVGGGDGTGIRPKRARATGHEDQA